MNRQQRLENSVKKLYDAKNPNRADWADWLADNHVFVVADFATELAERFNADSELARVAALLHDIADTQMSRFANEHESASLQIARKLMEDAGYNNNEIKIVVDDAIKYHSCHDGHTPDSLEGKILAAADSLAHLKTDFYVFAVWAMAKEKSLDDIKSWALKKIDRDFNAKIVLPEVKSEAKFDYERLNTLFSR